MNKLIAIYQKAVYAQEQKNIWESWGSFVDLHIANEYQNVTALFEKLSD